MKTSGNMMNIAPQFMSKTRINNEKYVITKYTARIKNAEPST
jgi:hypothetical protein